MNAKLRSIVEFCRPQLASRIRRTRVERATGPSSKATRLGHSSRQRALRAAKLCLAPCKSFWLCVLFVAFSFLPTACTGTKQKLVETPPSYPVSRDSFRELSVQWMMTDDDAHSDRFEINHGGKLEAEVRTREAGQRKTVLQLSDSTFNRLLAAINRAKLRRVTLSNGGPGATEPMLSIALKTSTGQIWDWYGNQEGEPARIIGRFCETHLWPLIDREIRTAGLTRSRVRPQPPLPLPELQHASNLSGLR
jgi:hypothetical protein